MAHWRDKLEQIRHAQLEIMRSAPFKDIGLVPNPAASESAIATAEARLGVRLPAVYREFLALYDGWPRFYEGATLLGTANLGRREYEEVVQSVFRAAETPVPDVGPPSGRTLSRRPLIPFGIDLQGTTLFAFDLTHPARASGELPVIAWVNELGFTFADFTAFLDALLDWLALDREGSAESMLATG